MHRLRAVVKSFKADPVCQALLKAGVDEVYVEEVQGYGRQKGHLGLYRQPAYGISFLPKIAITAYLSDDLVEPACKAIEEAALTGTIGDGKIFITPIDYAIPHTLEMAHATRVAAASGAAGGKPAGRRKPAARKKPAARAAGAGKPQSTAAKKKSALAPRKKKPAGRSRKPR